METLRCHFIASLIEKRVLNKNRFFGKFFNIAIDATGACNRGDSPPEDIRKFDNGMSIPLMSEWMANDTTLSILNS